MSHVQLTQTAHEATTTLVIMQDESSQSLLSVNGTQQTRQYLLRVTVVFEILDKNGQTIVPAQTLTETKVITIQSNQILGSSNEANLYYLQMRSRLAYAIMLRIASDQVTRMIDNATPITTIKTKKKS
jgi:outer membrane lipopolysaccharide assembly protein LptE/RlpB